jgi:hypothetical protein
MNQIHSAYSNYNNRKRGLYSDYYYSSEYTRTP